MLDLRRVELRQLRYFVAVAEELQFTRAAARLHLAQSALSAQVKALEESVGATLLTRTTRHVELTAVGEVFLVAARDLIADADRLVAGARSQARREAATLSVGCLGAVPGELLPRILDELAKDHPHVCVEIQSVDFAQVVRSLEDARVDLAFGYLPFAGADEADIDVVPLATEPRVVVLPRTHPLAGRASLRPEDLAGETFISHGAALSEEWRDFWLLTDELGFRPAVHPSPAADLDQYLHLIGQGRGIDTAPAMMATYYPWPGVRYVPLVDAAPATLTLLRHRDANEPVIVAFVEIAARLARAGDVEAEV